MGFSTHYFKDLSFFLTKVSGDISDDDLIQHIVSLNKETKELLILKELSDCRKINSVTSLSTQATILAADIEQEKLCSKLAILVPKDNDVIYGMARAYQMFSEDKRGSVSLFSDFDEALMWLSENNIEEKELLISFINNA